jgi:hypothetical protein
MEVLNAGTLEQLAREFADISDNVQVRHGMACCGHTLALAAGGLTRVAQRLGQVNRHLASFNEAWRAVPTHNRTQHHTARHCAELLVLHGRGPYPLEPAAVSRARSAGSGWLRRPNSVVARDRAAQAGPGQPPPHALGSQLRE